MCKWYNIHFSRISLSTLNTVFKVNPIDACCFIYFNLLYGIVLHEITVINFF